MKKFLQKTLLMLLIPLLIFLIGMLLPPTPLAKQYLLTAMPVKDSLLANVPAPRVIFLSGSSISFGLNSQVFKDSLHLNPINYGMHGGIGLYFMMDHTAKFIRKGDIVVLIPEYHQMYGDFGAGGEELLRIIFDNAEPSLFFTLRKSQLLKTYPYIPKYALTKFMPSEYFRLNMNPIYSKDSYDQYGDAVTHWTTKFDRPVAPFQSIEGGEFNEDLLKAIVQFTKAMQAKGAVVLLSYAPLEKTSFENCRKQIDYLALRLKQSKLPVLGTPERFMVQPDMIYDTPYHLNKKGVDFRTKLLFDDVKTAIQKRENLN